MVTVMMIGDLPGLGQILMVKDLIAMGIIFSTVARNWISIPMLSYRRINEIPGIMHKSRVETLMVMDLVI